ncbi:nuclear transport factor 2 family protein [Caulobacter sp.]|uniref:nuclear transport factor 2 family protein n=1 Tax=Caulobacter sp. TaxID=78 RepID=UPI001B075115|nr:nuclear transport factor 2 family protein [Caulobacter sp.]MBO9544727.1 nuclear transport factor 2 family protein [Caulobacter sp.]
MTPDEDRIAQLYAAFNDRAFDRCVAMMADDVAWPNEVEDGLVEGREAVLVYFSETTAPLLARYDLLSLHTGADGRVSTLTRQTIVSANDGTTWSSTRVAHTFSLRDGWITGMEAQQDWQGQSFPGVDALLARLHAGLNAGDVEAVAACYAPDARFADTLEDGEIHGAEAVRAHFSHLFETVRLQVTVEGYALEPDDRVRARLHIVTRGLGGGLWQDDVLTVWYRLDRGLIAEQDIDDSSRDAGAP